MSEKQDIFGEYSETGLPHFILCITATHIFQSRVKELSAVETFLYIYIFFDGIATILVIGDGHG